MAPIAMAPPAASRWVAQRIGYTGDTLGAVQQSAEIAFLVVAARSSAGKTFCHLMQRDPSRCKGPSQRSDDIVQEKTWR
jgi:hypothetical protein